tara:strand:+ start:201 stop:395 length:195 start_codon:yes stop_codon:yes gene_type:complete
VQAADDHEAASPWPHAVSEPGVRRFCFFGRRIPDRLTFTTPVIAGNHRRKAKNTGNDILRRVAP